MVVDFVYKFKIDFDHYIPTNDNIRKVIKKSVKIQNLRNGVLGLTLTPTSSHKLNQFLIFKYFKFDGYTPQINLTKINKISKQGDYEEKHLFKLLECVIVHEHLHSLIWKEVKSNLKKYKAEKIIDILKKNNFEKYDNYKENDNSSN